MTDIIATIFWSGLGLATLGVWIEHLVRYLRHDGYGSTAPPRSHDHELDTRSQLRSR